MTLDLNFIYYRNFRFDGKFHVRCTGSDLDKVARIRYELRLAGAGQSEPLAAVSARSQARTGALVDHGCPATLITGSVPGTYRITPRVVLLERAAQAMGRPPGAAGVIDLADLTITIADDELDRHLLDKLPLGAELTRRKRSVQAAHEPGTAVLDPYGDGLPSFPYVAPGQTYRALLIKCTAGGVERLRRDLEPASQSPLARLWPGLDALIRWAPLLTPAEAEETSLEVLRRYLCIEQPSSMSGESFVELIKTLAALEYVQALQFLPAEVDPGNLLLGGAAVLATVITGGAVLAGNAANANAQPTPDYEALQTYLDEPGPRWQGLNIRNAWAGQVTGRGARIHFSDGGLFANHEALRGNPNLKIVTSQPNSDPDHGTASVGVILAMRNGSGVSGISHDSELYLHDNRASSASGASQTLKDLLRMVEPGDIVGINRQTANSQVLGTFLPSLHDLLWWDVCKQLANRGAVVLNAASNGTYQGVADKGTVQGYGVDLANWRYFNDHGDAGTIVVGACHSWDGKPHQYSNYHYRHGMLNAWGDSVTTLGYGRLQDKSGHDRDYTDTYGGTSSATPLVAGALSLIQSYAIERHHLYLNGEQMHLLVSASGYADATLPDTDVLPMGRRPNVHGALVMLDRLLGGGRFYSGKDEL